MRVSFVGTKLHKTFVEKNKYIENEYNNYIRVNSQDGKRNRALEWIYLMRLNLAYFILNRRTSDELFSEPINMKLPYMDGAESELSKRPLPIQLAMRLLPYDIVSFDIFDTLIMRPFAKPTDLFYIIGKRLDMPEFYHQRVEAEKKAREIASVKNGGREITIYDIYELIEHKTGLPRDVGVKTEFEVELQYCKANPYMKQVFRMLREQRKTIIIVSDMYLPHDMMAQLLENCGYYGYEKLYVSCDYGCGKNTKELYKYVLRDFQGKSISHVGDNYLADVEMAKECGISAVYYKNVNEIGEPYRTDGMSELVGSAYAGVVNCHLHNGTKLYDAYYEYGFVYGGLYVFGYCNWIYQKAKREGIDKVLFLSRDGAIYQRVFRQFFKDIPSEYFLWSRVANSKYTSSHNNYLSIKDAIQGRINSKNIYTIGGMLDSFKLGQLRTLLSHYGLNDKTLVIPENLSKIEELFTDHWDLVVRAYEGEKNFVYSYIKSKVGEAKKVAVIDIGWVGSGPLGIKYLIEKEMKLPCEVACWQAAAMSSPTTNIAANLLDGTNESYIFSKTNNRNHFDTHIRSNRGLNHVFFEMFTQDCTPSYQGMTDDGKLSFQMPEVENYNAISRIQQGIFDFARIYYETFKYDSYLYSISGYDAYLPFRLAIREISFFKNNYSDFSFSRVIGENSNSELTETLYDLIEKAGYGDKDL